MLTKEICQRNSNHYACSFQMNNKQDWKNRYSLDEFDHNVLSEKDIFVGRFESTFGFEAKENIACL